MEIKDIQEIDDPNRAKTLRMDRVDTPMENVESYKK